MELPSSGPHGVERLFEAPVSKTTKTSSKAVPSSDEKIKKATLPVIKQDEELKILKSFSGRVIKELHEIEPDPEIFSTKKAEVNKLCQEIKKIIQSKNPDSKDLDRAWSRLFQYVNSLVPQEKALDPVEVLKSILPENSRNLLPLLEFILKNSQNPAELISVLNQAFTSNLPEEREKAWDKFMVLSKDIPLVISPGKEEEEEQTASIKKSLKKVTFELPDEESIDVIREIIPKDIKNREALNDLLSIALSPHLSAEERDEAWNKLLLELSQAVRERDIEYIPEGKQEDQDESIDVIREIIPKDIQNREALNDLLSIALSPHLSVEERDEAWNKLLLELSQATRERHGEYIPEGKQEEISESKQEEDVKEALKPTTQIPDIIAIANKNIAQLSAIDASKKHELRTEGQPTERLEEKQSLLRKLLPFGKKNEQEAISYCKGMLQNAENLYQAGYISESLKLLSQLELSKWAKSMMDQDKKLKKEFEIFYQTQVLPDALNKLSDKIQENPLEAFELFRLIEKSGYAKDLLKTHMAEQNFRNVFTALSQNFQILKSQKKFMEAFELISQINQNSWMRTHMKKEIKARFEDISKDLSEIGKQEKIENPHKYLELLTKLENSELVSKEVITELYHQLYVSLIVKVQSITSQENPFPLLETIIKLQNVKSKTWSDIMKERPPIKSNLDFVFPMLLEKIANELDQVFTHALSEQDFKKRNTAEFTLIGARLSNLVIASILSKSDLKERAKMMATFIKIAEEALERGNLAAAGFIMSGLSSAHISRLENTRRIIGDEAKNALDNKLTALKVNSMNPTDYFNFLKSEMVEKKAIIFDYWPVFTVLGKFKDDIWMANEDLRAAQVKNQYIEKAGTHFLEDHIGRLTDLLRLFNVKACIEKAKNKTKDLEDYILILKPKQREEAMNILNSIKELKGKEKDDHLQNLTQINDQKIEKLESEIRQELGVELSKMDMIKVTDLLRFAQQIAIKFHYAQLITQLINKGEKVELGVNIEGIRNEIFKENQLTDDDMRLLPERTKIECFCTLASKEKLSKYITDLNKLRIMREQIGMCESIMREDRTKVETNINKIKDSEQKTFAKEMMELSYKKLTSKLDSIKKEATALKDKIMKDDGSYTLLQTNEVLALAQEIQKKHFDNLMDFKRHENEEMIKGLKNRIKYAEDNSKIILENLPKSLGTLDKNHWIFNIEPEINELLTFELSYKNEP